MINHHTSIKQDVGVTWDWGCAWPVCVDWLIMIDHDWLISWLINHDWLIDWSDWLIDCLLRITGQWSPLKYTYNLASLSSREERVTMEQTPLLKDQVMPQLLMLTVMFQFLPSRVDPMIMTNSHPHILEHTMTASQTNSCRCLFTLMLLFIEWYVIYVVGSL